jgi:hypothetical protein
MERGVEKIRERLLRAAAALRTAKLPYAVIGGNAVAAWVSRVDEAAVRNTRDMDLLLRRADFDQARAALEAAGFIHRRVSSPDKAGFMDVFLDGPNARVRDAVHVLWAGEKVTEDIGDFRLIELEPLVRMKLTSFRDKDRVHLRDLVEVGLVDANWCKRFPRPLAERLHTILDTPEG